MENAPDFLHAPAVRTDLHYLALCFIHILAYSPANIVTIMIRMVVKIVLRAGKYILFYILKK